MRRKELAIVLGLVAIAFLLGQSSKWPASKVSITPITGTDILQDAIDQGKLGGEGSGGGPLLTTSLASSATASDCDRVAYNNSGTSPAETIVLTLCAATAGMEVWVIWEDTGGHFQINPNGSDRILSPDTNANGDRLSWTSPGIDNSVAHLYSPANAEWLVLEMRGSAAIDGGP